jgi:ribonuclease P protein component
MASGRRASGKRVVVLLAPGTGESTAVAGKRVGGSVERNRARRIVRAALRELRPALVGSDVVVVARPAIRGCRTSDVVAEIGDLLRA